MQIMYKQTAGNKYAHRVIVEKMLGRPLKSTEVVHHVDGNKHNNMNVNLVVCPDQKYHMMLHQRQRVVDAGGDPNKHKWCSGCKTLHKLDNFSTDPSLGDGLSNKCRDHINRRRRGKGYGKFTWRRRMDQQYRRALKKEAVCDL